MDSWKPAFELGTVVHHDLPGITPAGSQFFQGAGHPHAPDRRVRQQGQALPVEAVDNPQHFELPAVNQGIIHEIHCPQLIHPMRLLQRFPFAPADALTVTPPDLQALGPIQPFDPLVVILPAFSA